MANNQVIRRGLLTYYCGYEVREVKPCTVTSLRGAPVEDSRFDVYFCNKLVREGYCSLGVAIKMIDVLIWMRKNPDAIIL